MVSIQDLKGFELFNGLEDAALGEIAKLCRERVCEPESIYFTEGNKAEDLYLLRQGKVEIVFRSPRRCSKAAVTIIGPGRVFGWSALVEPGILTASARCTKRAQVITIRGADLLDIFEKNSHIGYVVMKNLSAVIGSRLTRTRQRLCLEMENTALKGGKVNVKGISPGQAEKAEANDSQ